MKETAAPDLQQVSADFAAWRARRVGRARVPKKLWESAVALLEKHSMREVCRALRIRAEHLRKHCPPAAKKKSAKTTKAFLKISAGQLTNLPTAVQRESILSPLKECRINVERPDGSRLTLCVPADWPRIEELLSSFLRQ